jgi:integrase
MMALTDNFESAIIKKYLISSMERDTINRPVPSRPELRNLTLEKVSSEYLRRRDDLAASTIQGYESKLRAHILPKIGESNIADIQESHISDLFESIRLSNKTKAEIAIVLRGIFKYSKSMGYVETNPLHSIAFPKSSKSLSSPKLTLSEIVMLLEQIDPYYKAFFVVWLFTGLSWGEISCLKWKHVDFNTDTITICEKRVRDRDTPSKRASSRVIDMLPMVSDTLITHKDSQSSSSAYVFTSKSGSPVRNSFLAKKVWRCALKLCNFPNFPMTQTCQNSFVSMMIEACERLTWIQKMIGHASLELIMRRFKLELKDCYFKGGERFLEEYYRRADKHGLNPNNEGS